MVLSEAVRSRLLSRVRPWLAEEPDLELKLGFLTSHGSATNLILDPSALNPLIEESTCLVFKRVKIGELSVRFSPWKSPSLVIEVRGIDVSLVPRELSGKRRLAWMDLEEKKRKEVIASIDPEGSSLHEIIERLSCGSGNQLTTSLLDAILGSCQITLHDIHMQLEFNDESHACLLQVNGLVLKPQPLHCTSLFKRFIGSSLLTVKENILDISCSSLMFGVRQNVHVNVITLLTDLSSGIKLCNIQPIHYGIQVSCSEVKLSPKDIPLLLIMLDVLSAKKCEGLRNGRELWKMTKQRISHSYLNSVLSFHKVIKTVVLWLRYMYAYKSLLLLVGFSAESVLEDNIVMVSRDIKLVACIKHQLRSVYELEEKLPAEAVARARQVARYRTLLHPCCTASQSSTSLMTMITMSFQKLPVLLSLVWKFINFISWYVACCISTWCISRSYQGNNTSASLLLGDFSSEKLCFILSLGELHVTLCPLVANHDLINGKAKRDPKIPLEELRSFYFRIKCLCLTWTVGITAKSLLMAFGEVKLCLSPSSWNSKMKNESKLIMWSDPALWYQPSESESINLPSSSRDASVSVLKNTMEELRSNWMRISRKYEKVDMELVEQPFFLCEFRSYLRDPYVNKGWCGLWKCSLQIGKLNIDMQNSHMLSAILLFRQMLYCCHLTSGVEMTHGTSCCSSISEVDNEFRVESLLEMYSNRMKIAMLNMIPEKNIHIGAVITGPSIRISPQIAWLSDPCEQNSNPIQRNSEFCFAFDLKNIEFAVWPVSTAVLAALTGELSFKEAESDYHWLKEPRMAELPKAHANEKFVSQSRIALDACLRFNSFTVSFDDLKANQKYHVIGPMSVALKSSTCRECLHGLLSTVNCISMALSGITKGGAVSLFMDELGIFLQSLKDMVLLASSVDIDFDFISHGSQDYLRKSLSSSEKDMRENMESGVTNDATIPVLSQILVDAAFEFDSMDILLNDSRSNHLKENYIKSNAASSSATVHLNVDPLYKLKTVPGMIDLLGPCMGIFINKSYIQLSWGDVPRMVLVDVSGIQSIINNHQSQAGSCTDIADIKSLLSQSSNHLCKFSLSSCLLTIHVGSHSDILGSENGRNIIDDSDSGYHISYASKGSPSGGAGLKDQILGPSDISATSQWPTVHTLELSSDCWILIDIIVGEVSIDEYCTKNQLEHHRTKLKLLVFVGDEQYTISCKIEGGYVFLETSAVATFFHCIRVYFHLMRNLETWVLSASQNCTKNLENLRVSEASLVKFTNHSQEECAIDTVPPALYTETKWKVFNTLSVDLSQISISLAVTDGSGGIQELIIETDMSLKLMSSGRKMLFDLSRLTIFTQHLHKYSIQAANSSLHFRTNTSFGSSSYARSENSSPLLVHEIHCDDCSVYRQDLQGEILEEDGGSKFSNSYHGSYILKHVAALIKIGKTVFMRKTSSVQFNSDWVGSGSITGFDLTITLSEIQMLLALLSPLSGISISNSSNNLKQNLGSRNCGRMENSDYTIPDGAIVAIQDLHQNNYFAVEPINNKYCLVGTLHYSLVGERALFRVRYHRRWRSRVPLFSLISLYAKNDQGIPLRLNCTRGSGFVELSSSDDKDWALWHTFSYKPDRYDVDDDDVESYNIYAGKAFHLVNQKNKCAVAFVDGLPEFVKKPGNPFKAKVFDEFSLPNDIAGMVFSKEYSGDACETTIQEELSSVCGEILGLDSYLPYVNITIDHVNFTILNDVLEASDKIPLLRTTVSDIQVIGQLLASKYRIMSSFNSSAHYFDAQRNLWRELVSPVNSYVFFRSRIKHQRSLNMCQGLPVRFYFRMRQVDVSVTELSLDILLYLAGKLDFAGPYAVRSSIIFANCCKVQNNSGLTLCCHFGDNQDIKIHGRQLASIFLRRVALADHPSENENLVSICLSKDGAYETLPISISLSHAHILAWRTRIVSLQDSRSFPGSFIVVEVSKNTEEGLSLVVSPMLKIHNESGLPIELRLRRPEETETESASVLLRAGDIIDDSMAGFDALDFFGGSKRTLMSLTLGNFLLSIRPEITEYTANYGESLSVKWSEYLEGGKAVCVTGIFGKLNYRFRKAFGVESVKSFFSTVCCPLATEDGEISNMHFIIQTIGRDVPLVQPPKEGDTSEFNDSPIALQVQKEIFIYPTIHVHNILQSEILVLLTENHPDLSKIDGRDNIGKQAIIPCGSSVYLYANPVKIYFTIFLTACNSKCEPVNSSDWANKLEKQKSRVHYLDIELIFGRGKYFASLRMSQADKGIMEAVIFTSYTLQNETEFTLYCTSSNHKSIPWLEIEKHGCNLPPELGCLLPPKSTGSWFLKSNKVHLKCLEEKASEALLDLNSLSGFTELCLEAHDDVGVNHVTKLGVSLLPCKHKLCVPLQLVSIVPRHVLSNDSTEPIIIRQCCLEVGTDEEVIIEGEQKAALRFRSNDGRKRRESNFFDSILRRHRNASEDSLIFIQFCLKDTGYGWSGPVCVSSFGRFFLKFKKLSATFASQSRMVTDQGGKSIKFALVHIVEESASLVLHFSVPPDLALPYRIENYLRGASIVYHQKDSMDSDVLRPGDSEEYVWDDLNLPHKLVVRIDDLHLLREININKVSTWKPLFKMRQNKGLILHSPLDRRSGAGEKDSNNLHSLEVFKVGYEVYADGLTRVLRICELIDSYKEEKMLWPCANFQFRVSYFAMHMRENNKQDENASDLPTYSEIIVARLANIALDSLITDQYKYNSVKVQSLNVDEKWQGAPFASMVRRSQLQDSGLMENVLHIIFILHSAKSNVKQVKFSSIILQPIDIKVDEETLMRIAPFWRTSLSDSRTQSQQFYFKHFEIHPIKIMMSFLPSNPRSSYSSAQETLRSLLHSVIKVPAINSTVVELNGVLLTHALVTFRELLIKCAQHYSWYVVRAIYIAKGSPLLPPAFASIFDDTAASSLDIFFDPSDGSISLPGLTLGMFKFINRCINSKGVSGTKRYFGDLGKTIKAAGSNVLFAAITEISDNVLRGAEASGFNGMINGFHQGILRLAMEPSLLGAAVMEGGPDRKIKLDCSPGVDELYIEGYLQAMLDVMYKQEYLRVRVIDNQVVLKNLPPNNSVIHEIMENVKSFLVSRALLKGDASTVSRPLRHLRTESEWRIGPTVLTLFEHLFVSFAIRMLRKEANKFLVGIRRKREAKDEDQGDVPSNWSQEKPDRGEVPPQWSQEKPKRKWTIGKFVLGGMIAYVDGRLCRHIPNPIARRIVSGFLLSFLDNKDGE